MLFLSVYELVLRVKGVVPFTPKLHSVKYEPEFIFSPSLKYGYTLKPGKYNFILPLLDSLVFKPTHSNDSTRIAQPLDNIKNKSALAIFGASYTYGFGVNDSTTFSWLLQKKCPDIDIINYGVPGYGPIHAYLKLKSLIAQNTIPKAVILGYSFYHDNTNTLPRKSRETIIRFSNILNKGFIENATAPYIDAKQEGQIKVHYRPYDSFYTEWPLRRYSALVNYLENTYNNWDERRSESQKASKKIISEIKRICDKIHAPFIVAGISDHQETKEMLLYCKSQDIQNVDISLNLNKNSIYRLHEKDGHPNAFAHRNYAKRLHAYLTNNKTTSEIIKKRDHL
ncbi:MAG TPA: hypothetical protein EYN89_09900 [Flavobacteriales bacterium]|nr:hypothetical protein [Flavobacteriales bacterium]